MATVCCVSGAFRGSLLGYMSTTNDETQGSGVIVVALLPTRGVWCPTSLQACMLSFIKKDRSHTILEIPDPFKPRETRAIIHFYIS